MLANLDPRSLIAATGVLSILSTVLILAMQRSFPPSIRGLRDWGVGCVLGLFSAPLFALRDRIPDLISIVFAQALLAGSILLCLAGLCRFTEFRLERRWLVGVWSIWVALIAGFTFVVPSFAVRQVIVGVMLGGTFLFSAWLVRRWPERSFAFKFSQFGYELGALVALARAGLVLGGYGDLFGTSLSDRTPMQNLYLVLFASAHMAFTLGFVLMAQERLVHMLRHEAAHDLLSGALSRNAILDQLNREVIRAHRHQRTLTLMLLDLDHFKQVNDRHGHLMGDRVIAEFGDGVRAQLREQDLFGRYGGEEFLVILPEADMEGAAMVAERIRCSTSRTGDLPDYSVSIGVCCLRPGQDALSLLAAADAALYRAKANGRDRVEFDAIPGAELTAVA